MEAGQGNDAEIVSGVRERLRNMSDIQVVYSQDEADLLLSLLALQAQSISGHPLGYNVAVVTSRACESRFGDSGYPFKMHEGAYLISGANVHEAVELVVSNLDANDLEDARKTRAAFKKYKEAHP